MLLLLVSLAMFGGVWGQTPNIRYIHETQQTLVNTTAQLRDMLSQHIQQQSTSESLTSLLQLSLARQLTADLDIRPVCNPSSSSCDCNETKTAIEQLKTESVDNKNAVQKLNADSKKLESLSAEAIRNLTTKNQKLKAQLLENEETINGLTKDIERLEAQSEENEEAISNLTSVVEMLVQKLNPNIIHHAVCGSDGWTRVAYLNMTNPSEQCPNGFRLYNQNGVRACGRPATAGSGDQSSMQFPINMSYSEVCGRVTGYQYGYPEAFRTTFPGPGIDEYVDGVSLTHGSPRNHIWTFAAGANLFCPCSTRSRFRSPALVGSDYFCESGYKSLSIPPQQLFLDPLWDGKGCSNYQRECCQAAGIPWFHKRLNSTTNDYIELRICSDASASSNEDIPVGHYEIYVK